MTKETLLSPAAIPTYGVRVQSNSSSKVEQAAEQVRLLGYVVVDGGYGRDQLASFSSAFDRALTKTHTMHGGRDELAKLDEHNTVRDPLSLDPLFLELAQNQVILGICRLLLGDYFVLNQQNGIVNPPNAQQYNQGAYHRDLPYQHFISSHPLMINALFCLDTFTAENGATLVVPASHRMEAFPSDAVTNSCQRQVSAATGSFIIMDSMLFHRGGVNMTNNARRAVNQSYSLPFIRQQINLPALLGPGYTGNSELRKLLGYDAQPPSSIDTFYKQRREKLLIK